MQTRRDQLQAYRFQNRRALAALVAGEPNLVDPPMRRLTITTISGFMIAVLVTVGFTVFGLIRPKAGDSWKDAGSIIVELDTGATYVYLDDTLYPVVNYTSAVLALGGNQRAKVVEVNSDDIADAKRGPQLGIAGLPSTLPSAGDLVRSRIAACSRQQVVANDQVAVRVSVTLGRSTGARALPADAGVLVTTAAAAGQPARTYLLYDGHRLLVAPGRTATSLGIADRRPLRVGRAFVDTIPAGADLRPPTLSGAGTPAGITGISAVVGQLVRTDAGQDFVAMPDGLAQVNAVQRALLQALPLGPGGAPLGPVTTTQSTAVGSPTSTRWTSVVSAQLAGLPAEVPTISTSPAANGAVCATFRDGSDEPRLAVPPSRLPSFDPATITESDVSLRGGADSVELPPGRAALVSAIGSSPTVSLVGDNGRRFPATSNEVLAGFGYSSDDVVKLPAALLKLVPVGRALSPTDARRPVTN